MGVNGGTSRGRWHLQCFLPAAAPLWARAGISYNTCRCSRFAGVHIVCAKIFSIKPVFTFKKASIWITVPTLLPYSSASGDKSLSQAVNWTGAFKVSCRSSQGYVLWPEHPLICELGRTWVSGYRPILRRAVFKHSVLRVSLLDVYERIKFFHDNSLDLSLRGRVG